jgi:hypothetical protein
MLATVFGVHSLPFAELRDEFWLRVMTRAAREGLPGLTFTFVFEPTVLPGFFERLAEALAAERASLHPFELVCSLEENERRVAQPDRRCYLKMVSAETLRGYVLTGDYKPSSPLPGNVVIDTTTMPADQTAALIWQHLRTDGLA